MKIVNYFFIVLISLVTISCQEEEEVVIEDTTQNIANRTPLTDLIIRVSQNPTSIDNVLDSSSCFRVQLPVTIVLNGNSITVNSETDYQLVQDAIDAFTTDDDIVNFNYPITIQYQDFTTQVLNDSDDLDDVLDACGEDDGFDEIDCVSVVYPILINVYDPNNELANTLTITSNTMLHNFLENLEDNEYVAINYPISMIDSNGETVIITNNNQLEDFIEDSIDDCDDDSGVSTPINLTGTWYVSYYFEGDDDETVNYNGYNFTFFVGGNIEVEKSGTYSNGMWTKYIDGGQDWLELDFDDSDLGDLEEDWKIVEFTETQLRLKHTSGGGGDTEYLYFTKN
ncbi:hypothetical protein [Flavobacterium sp.]|uniref:hypothetical protein n=1 Tax=Flavobacterium sp. TaxID=239 RepID=UPI00262404E8|nr:hypothetical protein [Flavobacterium sp.]